MTEARVPKASKVVGMTLRQVEAALAETDAQVVGLVRNEVRLTAPHPYRKVLAGDILVIEAEVKALPAALSTLGLKLEEAKSEDSRKTGKNEEEEEEEEKEEKEDDQSGKATQADADADADTDAEKPPPSDDIVLVELAVLPQSDLVGRSASDIQLRTHYGINMLAVSRQGRRSTARLRSMIIRASDVLLMQGPPETIAGFASDASCVPLAERALRIPNRRNAILSGGILALVIGATTLGLSAAIAFAAGVLATMILRTVPLRQVYTAIDWPVIVLLAALIPVAGAMDSTGAADLVARFLLDSVAQGQAVIWPLRGTARA